MQSPKADTELVLAELAQLPIGETLGREHLARPILRHLRRSSGVSRRDHTSAFPA